jgi:hypothetical protein
VTNADDSAVAVATLDDAATHASATGESAGRPADRWALIAFLVVAVVSIPLLLRLGHDRWFQFDDWDFLASETAATSAICWSRTAPTGPPPIIAYRAEWYLPGCAATGPTSW